jgi:hypothetical protein
MSSNDSKTAFSQQIANLAKGTLDAELTEALSDLVKAINDHGKKGSISLTLSLKPEVQHGEVKMIAIKADVKVSSPQPQRLSSIMWPTYDGDLLRDDPEQAQLDLKQVETQPKEEAKQL